MKNWSNWLGFFIIEFCGLMLILTGLAYYNVPGYGLGFTIPIAAMGLVGIVGGILVLWEIGKQKNAPVQNPPIEEKKKC